LLDHSGPSMVAIFSTYFRSFLHRWARVMVYNNIPLEIDEQRALIQWLRFHHLPHHHSPNETGHTVEAKRRATKMKALGTSKGFPDLLVVLPSGLVFIELKRRSGSSTSPEQAAWVRTLNNTPGAAAAICKGAVEAIDFIKRYMD